MSTMIEPLTFISPLSPQDCIQRLEKLAEKKHFLFSSGRFIIHLKVDAIEASRDSFNLYVLCNPQRFELPAFIFFKLIGEINPTENGTIIKMYLQLHKPFSKAELGFLVFWSFILVLALTGGIIGVLSSTLTQGLFIGLAFALAGIGYAWTLYRTYKLGMTYIPNLVYKTLQQDLSETSQGRDKLPEWVSSLSESQ